MITLKNHFNGNDTYIVGKYIINDWLCLPVEKLDEAAKALAIPADIIEQVRELALNNSAEDWEEIVKHENWVVKLVATLQIYGLAGSIEDEDFHARMAFVALEHHKS